MKKVQIDAEVFDLLCAHFCDGYDLTEEDLQTVSEALRRKKESMVVREYYSRAKDPKKGDEERLQWMKLYKSTKAIIDADRD